MKESTKLTLSIKRSVIQKARKISKSRKKSISALFEEYIQFLYNETIDQKKEALERLKKSPIALPENFNFDKAKDLAYKKKFN